MTLWGSSPRLRIPSAPMAPSEHCRWRLEVRFALEWTISHRGSGWSGTLYSVTIPSARYAILEGI